MAAEYLHFEARIDGMDDVAVACPLCFGRPVLKTLNVFHCPCGFRLGANSDAIGLADLGLRLRDVSAAHSNGCAAVPSFGVDKSFGVDILMLTCRSCNPDAASRLTLEGGAVAAVV
jgi:hypothetical protein